MKTFDELYLEVTKKDIMSGLSNISQGYVDKNGNLYTRNSKGQLFRKDEDGYIRFINDKEELHREDGPALEGANGSKYWFLNGEYHREDGPAVEFADGTKHWYLNDLRHREDGPAIEDADGRKYWFLNGVSYTKPQWRKKVKELQLK